MSCSPLLNGDVPNDHIPYKKPIVSAIRDRFARQANAVMAEDLISKSHRPKQSYPGVDGPIADTAIPIPLENVRPPNERDQGCWALFC